jgi:hypothetical protein
VTSDSDRVDAFPEVGKLVEGLRTLVEMQRGPTLAVGMATPDGVPDVRIPPPGFARSSIDVETKLLGALANGLTDETTAIGIVFPAVRRKEKIDVCVPARPDGHAVCVALRTPAGVGSVGLYRETDGDWVEAHAELDWLCERLRLTVARQPLEADESVVYEVGAEL